MYSSVAAGKTPSTNTENSAYLSVGLHFNGTMVCRTLDWLQAVLFCQRVKCRVVSLVMLSPNIVRLVALPPTEQPLSSLQRIAFQCIKDSSPWIAIIPSLAVVNSTVGLKVTNLGWHRTPFHEKSRRTTASPTCLE